MKESKLSSCPFANSLPLTSKQKIQLENPIPKNWIKSSFFNIQEIFSRFGFQSLRNAWLSYSLADLNAVFSKTYNSEEIIFDFKTPIGTQYVVKDHAILQVILSHFRNENNGHFHVPENKRIFIDQIIKDLYPEELAKIGDLEKEVINAMIFTAEAAHIPDLRARVMAFVKQKSVQEYREQIEKLPRKF